MNHPILAPAGTGLQMLGLALMIGGLLALGAFTAPVLFKSFARPEAGEAMMVIFRRYDIVLLAAIGLILLGEVLRILTLGFPALSFAVIARYVVMVGLVGMTCYSTLALNPQLAALHQNPDFRKDLAAREDFNATHKLTEKFAKMELMAGVVLLLMTPFLSASSTKLP